MKIIAIDDETLALKMLSKTIAKVQPEAEIHAFTKPSQLLTFTNNNLCDIAFLDIEMPDMNGLQLAIALKNSNPRINIIFVTGHSGYAEQAFSLHASGYILKPVSEETVKREIDNLRHPIGIKTDTGVFVQTFGHFDIFVDGKPLVFSRSKAKELFAYLIDRQGASVTTPQIAAVLWEDKEYNRSTQKQTQTVISAMMKTFREAGIQDVIIKSRNSISVDRRRFECDYYRLIGWETGKVNAYCGEYMANYSWAEMTAGLLAEKWR